MISTARPILCYVTERASLPVSGDDREAALLERVHDAAAAGVDWIELREKDLEARALVELARAIRTALHPSHAAPSSGAEGPRQPSALLLINDRLDVAWAAGADGVHLGESSLPVAALSEYRNEAERSGIKFIVGASCHSLERAQHTERDGADYVFFGPVFATPSKAAFGPPQGLAKLEEICRAVSIPVLAIGGISTKNAHQCLEAGAAGIAAISLFQQAGNLAEVVADLKAKLKA